MTRRSDVRQLRDYIRRNVRALQLLAAIVVVELRNRRVRCA
jgi:hypothetical protein